MADDAGALLVRSGLVTASALDDARARAIEVGGTIGEQLVASGVLTDDVLTDFYRSRLLVPQVNPNTLARLSIEIIGLIPNDMAIELRVVPVSLDDDNNLTVAMSDPSDRHAVDEVAFFTGAYVVRAVATQMQIAWCLAHYYGHVTNLGQRLLRPEGAPEPQPAARPQRQRGITGEVDAMRHRGLVPGEARVEPDDAPNVIVDGSEPPEPVGAGDGAVTAPRPRSVSGEIRAHQRAPSIKPPIPDDSGPVITMEADDSADGVEEITIEAGSEQSGPAIAAHDEDDDTGRARRAPPKRLRPADPDPPELAARAGEVDLKAGIDRDVASGPSIVIDDSLDGSGVPDHVPPTRGSAMEHARETSGEISRATGLRDVSGEIAVSRARSNISVEADDEDSAPVMIHESLRPARVEDEPSAPILLDRKRPSDPPPNTPIDTPPEPDDDEIVELPRKPTRSIAVVANKRSERRTVAGIGVVGTPRPKHDTVEAIPAQLEDDPTGEHVRLGDAIDRALGRGPGIGAEAPTAPAAPAAPIDVDPTRVDTFVAPGPD
ncbi:MAG: hypothetical protein ABI467_01235, partial [Kofleriaceae bacterium]